MDLNISSKFQKAQQYEKQGNLAQAKVAYESVLRQSPHHELSRYVFGMKKFMSEYEAILTSVYQYAGAGQAAQIIDVENLSS